MTKSIRSYLAMYNLPWREGDYQWTHIKHGNGSLFLQIFTPPEPQETVLFLHGFFDHTGTHASLIRHLMSKNYRVIAFDLPGHGMSGGNRYTISSFEEYLHTFHYVLEELNERGFTTFHGVGHSTGAAIMADYLLSYPENYFQNICLISPLLRSSKWWLSKASTPLVSLFLEELPRKFKEDAGVKGFMERLQQDPLQGKVISLDWVKAMFEWEKKWNNHQPSSKPILILQGTNDETVAWKHNMKRYAQLFPNSKRILVNNGVHHLLNERENKKEIVYALLSQYLKLHK